MPAFILDPNLFTSLVAASTLIACGHGQTSAVWCLSLKPF